MRHHDRRRPWRFVAVLVHALLHRWLACAACAALAAGCVFAVDYPTAGRSLTGHDGQTLVFGRIRTFAGATEYRPWDPASFVEVPLYLALLRLGPRRVAPGLQLLADGRFYWWVPPGDYALVANRHDVYSQGTPNIAIQDMHVLALLRVPAGGAPVYAGELRLELAGPVIFGPQQLAYEFGETRVEDDMAAAAAELARRFGPPADAPIAVPLCAGKAVPAFDDPKLFERGRALLDAGCRP